MKLERAELRLVLLMSCIQFLHTVDFVLMMPLAPLFMKAFGIGTDTFSLLVSSYTWSASIFGIIGALFMDRFDRKVVLLVSFGGFAVGTALCALAPSAFFLLAARSLAGAFSGVMISTVFSIIADVVPESRRGTALGMLMAAFPVASVLGVPFGTLLANKFDWHTPFWVLALMSFIVLAIMSRLLPPVRMHLERSRSVSSWRVLWDLLQDKKVYPPLAFGFVLMLAAFTVIPFLSAYLVGNVGFPLDQLHLVYLFGGLFTFFTSQIIGRLSDRYGKRKLFRIVALLSIIPLIGITNLPPVSMPLAIAATTLFMILISGRFVPAMAMITSAINPERRGAFMSLSTSVQQLGSGCSSFLGGVLIVTAADGSLQHFSRAGLTAVIATILALVLSSKL